MTDNEIMKGVVVNVRGNNKRIKRMKFEYGQWTCIFKDGSSTNISNVKPVSPDWIGFGESIEDYESNGLPIGFKKLIELADKYNTPIPKNINW